MQTWNPYKIQIQPHRHPKSQMQFPCGGGHLSRGPRLAESRVPSDTIPLVCEASDGEAVRVKPLAEERSAFSAARAVHGETPNE